MSCFLKVLTRFFTLAVARLLSVRVRVSIPKSDRLSNEKEKNVLFLARQQKDYELKLQDYCELDEKSKKIFLKSKETCEFAL